MLLVFGFLVPRLISKDCNEQGMLGFAIMFDNVGFIGAPIVSSIFGPHAVFYAALPNMPDTFFIFTAGVMLVKGDYSLRKLNAKVLFSPAMIAAFAAAIIVNLGIHPRHHRTPHDHGRQHHRACRHARHRLVDGASAAAQHHWTAQRCMCRRRCA